MKHLIIIVLFLGISFTANAQFSLGLKSYPSLMYNDQFDLAMNGSGLDFQQLLPFDDKWEGVLGAELSVPGWGPQAMLHLGARYALVQTAHFTIEEGILLLPGLTFTQPRLFCWGLEWHTNATWHVSDRFGLEFGIGLRYSNSPAYKNYGNINKYLDVPIRFGLVFGK